MSFSGTLFVLNVLHRPARMRRFFFETLCYRSLTTSRVICHHLYLFNRWQMELKCFLGSSAHCCSRGYTGSDVTGDTQALYQQECLNHPEPRLFPRWRSAGAVFARATGFRGLYTQSASNGLCAGSNADYRFCAAGPDQTDDRSNIWCV